MRIGLTCTTIEPTLTHGKIDGIGIYTKTLLEHFQKLNHEVIPYSFLKKNQTAELANSKKFPFSYTKSTLLAFLKPFTNTIFDAKLDLLHVTDHMIPRVSPLPVIATIHDALMFKHPEWYPSRLRAIKNYLRKATMQWPQHFITVSHAMVKELVELLHIPAEKISVVYNGIADSWFETISENDRAITLQKLGLPEKFILFTGTLQPKKNLPNIIQAFLMLPKDIQQTYPLVICGKAGWGCDASLAAIQQLTKARCGYWLNYVSMRDLQALYQSAALYVCPSLHEGFGYTLLEGLASKTPVITSNVSAMPEVAGDAALLVDPLSTTNIKNALQNLLTNPTLRETLIKKGHAHAQNFTLEKCATETLATFQRVLEKS